MASYGGQSEYRQISIGLWLGLLAMPLVFVWCLLAKGYSPRARIIAFGALTAFIVIGILTYKPSPESVKVATVAAAPKPSKRELEEAARAERAALKEEAYKAYIAFLKADRGYDVPNGEVEAYNATITAAYNRFVAAEKAYHGENWEATFVAENTTTEDDCKQFYGGFIREDDTIRTMRAICAANVLAGPPEVPTLLGKTLDIEPVDTLGVTDDGVPVINVQTEAGQIAIKQPIE